MPFELLLMLQCANSATIDTSPTMAPMPYLPYQLIQEIHADIVNGGDLIDDSTNKTPVMGSAHTPNLRQRFLDRLSTFVGVRTSLKEDKTSCSIVITLSSTNQISSRCLESEELQQFLQSMKGSLEQISSCKTGMFFSGKTSFYLLTMCRCRLRQTVQCALEQYTPLCDLRC